MLFCRRSMSGEWASFLSARMSWPIVFVSSPSSSFTLVSWTNGSAPAASCKSGLYLLSFFVEDALLDYWIQDNENVNPILVYHQQCFSQANTPFARHPMSMHYQQVVHQKCLLMSAENLPNVYLTVDNVRGEPTQCKSNLWRCDTFKMQASQFNF
jgi:hypothetical protein